MRDFKWLYKLSKSVKTFLIALIKAVRKTSSELIGFLELQYRPAAAQIRWAAVLIIALIAFQLFRAGRVSSGPVGEMEPPAVIKCTGHVQVGGEDGRVVCLDAGIAEFAAAGLPHLCFHELAGKSLKSGDRILWRLSKEEGRPVGCRIELARMSPLKLASLDVVLNLNTASGKELESIPGVGPKTAMRIVRFRNKHGPFRDVEGLLEIEGIGEGLLERIRKRLYCGEFSNPMKGP